jgi:hypothetical protein
MKETGIMLYKYTLPWAGFELNLVVIVTNYIGTCKSNYHMITMAMEWLEED